jgi:serine protease AprX
MTRPPASLVFVSALCGWLLAGSPTADCLAGQDAATLEWVFFVDKKDVGHKPAVTPRALARRRAAGFVGTGWGDLPVTISYLAAVQQQGAHLRHTVKWLNAASFSVPAGCLDAVRRLPCVKKVMPVARCAGTRPVPGQAPIAKRSGPIASLYGGSFGQLDVLSVPQAQHYLDAARHASPGTGVLIGIFDTGFFLDHACFGRLRNSNALVADSDFVDHDHTINHADIGGGSHGSCVLSLIAGYDPGAYMGVAWDARFVLARTEDDFAETHAEEDDWAAAAVWAESLGVDIISSSLGYRSDFTSGDDYSFSQMDGKTAIVSIAADSAVARGVIVVNSMGNEHGQLGDTSISAPADVEGVVSVGAVGDGLRIASFSSTGPTADGRIKPDVVAPGVGTWGPFIHATSSHGYGYIGNGTSFAAPLVAGLCALIRQMHPGATADSVRRVLYASCAYTPFQDTIDNTYGRGVPNALTAIMRPAEAYLQVSTTLGAVVAGAIVRDSAGNQLGLTDTAGVAIVTVPPGARPTRIIVVSPWRLSTTLTVPSTPSMQKVTFNVNKRLVVSVRDPAGRPVPTARITWNLDGDPPSAELAADTAGIVSVNYFSLSTDTIVVTARAAGYYPADAARLMCGDSVCSLAVTLTPRPASHFVIYPNVVGGAGARTMKAEFVVGEDAAQSGILLLTACVRTGSGTVAWQTSRYVEAGDPVVIAYDCRNAAGAHLVPGMYFFTITYGGKQYLQKFLITQ